MNYADLLRIYESGEGDVNSQDVNGMTLLMWVCQTGNVGIVEGLLKRGADTEKAGLHDNYGGHSALDFACSYGHMEILKLLVKYGANIQRPNPVSGWTAFMNAVYYNQAEIVAYLLRRMTEEQIQHRGLHGRSYRNLPLTALNIAIDRKHLEIVALIKDTLTKKRLERLRHIKTVVFKVFDAMDKHEVIEPTLGPSLTIAEFCGVPKGLCHSPSACGDRCRHFRECSICGYMTKYKGAMLIHEKTHL